MSSQTTISTGLATQTPQSGLQKPAKSLSLAGSHDTDVEAVKADPSVGTKEQDPNIVDFDGPDDPANPLNWPSSRKVAIVASLSFMTLVTPLASSMFAPALPQVAREFEITNSIVATLTVSIYLVGLAIGPLALAPLAELYGKTYVYHACNLLFIIFTVACAVSTNTGMLIAFRLFEGAAGSAVLTNGGGSISDLYPQHLRGKAMAGWSIGALLGPALGPVIAGFLSQAVGWRWVFWFISILAGVTVLILIVSLKETYAPRILELKTRRLRKETGNPHLRSKYDTGLTPSAAFSRAIIRPLRMLYQPIVFSLSLFNAIAYGYLYLMFTTIPRVFQKGPNSAYDFTEGTTGLAYLGLGVSMLFAVFVFGYVSDRQLKAKAGKGEMKPEYRLPPMVWGGAFMPVGLLIYAWTTEYKVQFMVPIIATGFLGFGILFVFMPTMTYLVDAYGVYGASAIAANTVLRSFFGAFLPLAGPPLYNNLGLGWGNSLLAFIAIAFLPVPLLFCKYGEFLRTNERFRVKF